MEEYQCSICDKTHPMAMQCPQRHDPTGICCVGQYISPDDDVEDRHFSSGSKRDSSQGKPPLSKLPFTALAEVARVHKWGDDHYGMGNWRKGQPLSVLYDSLLRHAAAVMRGDNLDPKTKLYHAAHMCWNGLVILHQLCQPKKYALLDDRLDDQGNWVCHEFAESDLAKKLESGGT